MATIKVKNNINSELSITHADNKPAKSIIASDIAVAVDTINDFPLDASDGDTVIVRDLNRGGTFIYDSTKVAGHNDGTNFNGWIRQYSGAVNVKWFGAKGDGVADDTVSMNNACKFPNVYVPTGTYLTNLVITNRIILSGDGSDYTKLKAKDNTKSVLRYAFIDGAWMYNSVVEKVGFYSTGKVGIGVAFGKDSYLYYSTNDEYTRNVTFNNCYFYGFNKGVYFPFGNIGETFNDCGFSTNKYGIYALSNKFGGIMHAGNKYFNQGEFSGNDCAVYIHNTTDGFSGVVFRNTIFEANAISNYIYATGLFFPVSYYDVWFEANGSLLSTGTTTIDQWSGTTLSTVALGNKTFYVDGSSNEITFIGGRVTGIQCVGTACSVVINKAPAVSSGGYGGEFSSTKNNSFISYNNYSIIGELQKPNQLLNIKYDNLEFINNFIEIASTNIDVSYQRTLVEYVQQNVLNSGLVNEKVYTNTLETATNTGFGSFNLTGTVVSDGVLFQNCNEYTRANFASNEYTALGGSITPPAGYTVISYYVKCTAGSVVTFTWNRSTVHVLSYVTHNAGDGWRLVSGMYKSDGSQSFFPCDFNGVGVTATWRVSALQVITFDKPIEAFSYFTSKNFTV